MVSAASPDLHIKSTPCHGRLYQPGIVAYLRVYLQCPLYGCAVVAQRKRGQKDMSDSLPEGAMPLEAGCVQGGSLVIDGIQSGKGTTGHDPVDSNQKLQF